MAAVARSVRTWGVLSLVVLLLSAVGWHAATRSVDFPIYHRAGAAALTSTPELYPPGLYTGAVVDAHGFRYAPALAWIFAPLAPLPLEAAAFLFYVLKLAAVIATFGVLARRIGPGTSRWTLLGAGFLITGGYVLEELRNGNFHLWLVCLIVIAFDGAERRRVVSSASALAVAIAAKLMPFALVVYAALQRRWHVVGATTIVLGLLWLLPAATWGWSWHQRLTHGFVAYSAQKMDESVEARNYSVRGALRKYRPFNLSFDTIDGIWWGVIAISTTVLVVVARRPAHPVVTTDFDLALLLTAMPLLAPHTQRIHFSALIVVVAIVIGHLARSPALPLRRWLIASLAVTAIAGTVLPVVLPGRAAALAYLDLSPYTWSTLLLALVLCAVVLHPRARRGVTA